MAFLISAVCGLLLTLALPPLGWWPLLFAIAPPFALAARSVTPRRVFWLGFAFGLPFFTVYVLWLPRSFAQLFGAAFWFVYPPMVALLALFWGVTFWAAWRLAGGRRERAPGAALLWLLPPLWVLVEWARTQGYFAFPWGTLGYGWLDTPVAQLAEYGGVYGLSLLVVVPAALLAWPWAATRRSGFGLRLAVGWSLAVALVVGSYWFGAGVDQRVKSQLIADDAPPLRALLVQGNVDPFARAVNAAQELNVHLALTEVGVARAPAPVDLVVWPEGAVLGYQLEAGDAIELRETISASAPGAGFIVGGRAYDAGDSFNTLFSLRGSTLLGRYDKAYLVPFGERWPLMDQLSGLYSAVFSAFGLPMLAGTSPGSGPYPLPSTVGEVGAFICYESVFPQVQRAEVAAGAGVLVLATNDAWFGLGNGAVQHFDMGRLRPIETRRWLLRAGNDGITAAVDPSGRVTAQLERHVAGSLLATFSVRHDLTLWVRYGAYTPIVLLGWLLLVGGLLAFLPGGTSAQQGRLGH